MLLSPSKPPTYGAEPADLSVTVPTSQFEMFAGSEPHAEAIKPPTFPPDAYVFVTVMSPLTEQLLMSPPELCPIIAAV